MKTLDLIVPCYNEEECVKLFYEKAMSVVPQIEVLSNWQVIFVNDGSKDNTLEEILKIINLYGDEHVKYVSFSRNFGKESAIYAGLSYSTGDYVVLMDADLQHPLELLPEMVKNLGGGVRLLRSKKGFSRGRTAG